MTIEELEAKIKTQDEALKAEKAKVNEFRDNNLALNTSVEALNAKLKGVDLDEYAKLQKEAKEAKEAKNANASDVEKLTDEFTKFRTEQEKRQKVLETNNAILVKENEKAVIDSAIKGAAIKAGISKTALDDVAARANAVWTVKDGKPVALDKDGATIWVKDTTEPLTIDKWLGGLNETAPHLFGESKGTGAENLKYDGKTKTMNRQTFDAISQKDRAAFFKDGGKLID